MGHGQTKMPPEFRRHFCVQRLLAALLAGLVRHAAGRLARRLAGGLAFAAAAVFRALDHISGFDRFDPLHRDDLLSMTKVYRFSDYTTPRPACQAFLPGQRGGLRWGAARAGGRDGCVGFSPG